jgi:hypothetical protein
MTTIAFAACKPGLIGPQTVTPENRIELTEESDSGAWDTDDLVVSYRYQRSSEGMTISGKVEFFGGVANFDAFERFSLNLYWVDDAGRVVGNNRIAAAGYYQEMGPISFKRTLRLPADATSFSFGYSGTAISGGSDDDGGMSWRFWETPGG